MRVPGCAPSIVSWNWKYHPMGRKIVTSPSLITWTIPHPQISQVSLLLRPAPGGHQPCLFLSPSRRTVVVFSRTSRMGKRCPRMWSFDCEFRESSGSTRHSGPSNPNTFSRSLSIYSPSSSAQPTKQLGWRDRTLAICWYQPLHHAHNVVSRPHAALCS